MTRIILFLRFVLFRSGKELLVCILSEALGRVVVSGHPGIGGL